MLVVGAAMFGMFYFITFFVQGVRDYGPLKTGVAFLPVAFTIGIVSQVVARLLPTARPEAVDHLRDDAADRSRCSGSRPSVQPSSYATKLLPGMLVLAVAMGFLFVPLTVTAVSAVANTDAGLASALLNVGQQVGGALGLSVMTTVFGTSARNYANGHISSLLRHKSHQLPGDCPQQVGGLIKSAGSNGLQTDRYRPSSCKSLPAGDQSRRGGQLLRRPVQGLRAPAAGARLRPGILRRSDVRGRGDHRGGRHHQREEVRPAVRAHAARRWSLAVSRVRRTAPRRARRVSTR